MDTKTEVQWTEMEETRSEGDGFVWAFVYPFGLSLDGRVVVQKTLNRSGRKWVAASVVWDGKPRLDAARAGRFAVALIRAGEIARELDELHPAGSPYTPPQPGDQP